MVYGQLTDDRLKQALEKALNLNSKIIVTVQIKKAPAVQSRALN